MPGYDSKSKEELESELRVRDMLKTEREESDRRYAIKLVETIVFILVGILATGVLGALLRLVIKQ